MAQMSDEIYVLNNPRSSRRLVDGKDKKVMVDGPFSWSFGGATLVDEFIVPTTNPIKPGPESTKQANVNNPSKDTRQRQFRAMFRKWRQRTLKRFNPTNYIRPIPPVPNCKTNSNENYTQLIRNAILDSPTSTRSTIGICEDIMKTDDSYRTNRRSGWQERVAEELMQNPAFRPVVRCRKGVVIKSKDIHWQISPQVQQTVRAFGAPSSFVSKGGPFELDASPRSTASTVVNRKDTESASSNADTNLPSYDASALSTTEGSCMSGRGDDPLHLADQTVPGPSHTRSRLGRSPRAPSTSFSGKKETRRVQLYDPPMEAGYDAQQDDNGNSSSTSQHSSAQKQQGTNETGAHNPGKSTTRPFPGRDRLSRENGGSPSDNEDDIPDRKKRRFRSPSRAQNKRKFACVYHKFDPSTYGVHNRQYLVCAGTGFEYVSELIRHLSRNHNEFVCGKCLRSFYGDELRRDHQKRCTVQLRCSQEQRWAGLWTTRFPDVPVPKDPCRLLPPSRAYLQNIHKILTDIHDSSDLEASVKVLSPLINIGRTSFSPSFPAPHGRQGSASSTTQSSSGSSATLVENNDSLTAARRNHLKSSNIPMKGKTPAVPIDTSLNMVEIKVDYLEKRLSLLEETVKLLRLDGQSQPMGTAQANTNHNAGYVPSPSCFVPANEVAPTSYVQNDLNSWMSNSGCNNAKTIDNDILGIQGGVFPELPNWESIDLHIDEFLKGTAV